MDKPMSFEEFKKSGRPFDERDEEYCFMCEITDPGRIYADSCWIVSTENWKPHAQSHKWYTLIGNQEFMSDSLDELELILYNEWYMYNH